MIIRDMFAEDINRKINGVIKVDQDTTDVIEQEVREYVITKELKKHFISFFDYYSDAFDKPTADIGVWISGFFGSGKSHFLKMLSYILENKSIGGIPTVEKFRQKFADDPATFMLIDRATRGKTETILFNIDIEGSINKDKTAVLRVFAKMFYTHLGFYGENLKVAMLEQYIDQLGKTEEFRRVFEAKKGKPWTEQRKAFAFNGKFIVPTLMEVLDMSEEDAKCWFNDKTAVEFSIARLVEDIKSYVNNQPDNFRLLFMIDEVGQYVGTDTDMLLNLQSLTEKIGSECGGKVWVMCTGQEAIDEIIKVRADEFSRIQARFKTRLSLSSSSVDEVIQKRILKKKPEAEQKLEALYQENDSVLRNLFSFTDSILDIKGFAGAGEFAVNFPFVPYQFIIMQKVFAEIRKHGNSGKHLSGGERSMLSGFQEAAQKIQDQDEYALVPFFRFYDTVHSFLDSSIRRVIERCQNAADMGAGIQPQDVDVLKLLYLIRYVDDIPANVDNIVILMADDIRTDKIVLREKVGESLGRLMSQNYIGRSGETYNFLTDEEQDIQRDINNTVVDTASIVERIAQMIYADIYQTKKFRRDKYDFDFDKMVDGVTTGAVTGGMKLRFLTVATDAVEKSELRLMTESHGQAIVVLPGSSYYESLESAMKIRKFVKQRNVAQLPKSMQDIIRDQQDEATRYEQSAMEDLKQAIVNAAFYVDGEHIEIRGGDAKSRIDQALDYLVTHVYSELDLVNKNMETDADVEEVLTGNFLPGAEPNRDAAAKVEEFLVVQDRTKLPTSMYDVQSRYQGIPYGWREIDIAAVVALLINQQKVTIKYGGATIQPDDPKLLDMLRKKNEIGKTSISIRQAVTAVKMKAVKELLREFFDVMDVPDDEDGLVAYIVKKFEELKTHYEDLNQRYTTGRKYPDQSKVQQAMQLATDVLSQKKDNIALIDRLLKLEDQLFDSKEDLQAVEGFFKNQVQVFDAAAQMEENLRNELDYLSREPAANDALNKIRLIVAVQGGFSYQKIPELNGLMATVRDGHGRLLDAKRAEVDEMITQCMGAVHQAANGDLKAKDLITRADKFYAQQKQKVRDYQSLALLDGLIPPMLQYKDDALERIETLLAPPAPPKPPVPLADGGPAPAAKKVIRPYNRSIIFPAKKLETMEDVDDYVEKIREQLKQLLKNCDGIQLK
ncbi:BREX system P-loop protein BrxC [Subdoligranulum sp. DSM 109015]|uniref:BREX system P-loop protein BrxC n=1 Tax=Gemmiger gallinarum TaxID=2779354 RepID=A0ABR9R694_9FIRM|nr:BREX system P-loop protein BrxC [Gemmiger gallinarum]MBE5038676.1 BREX system P-loop protein BrxC [Gemmiger gallinarum]